MKMNRVIVEAVAIKVPSLTRLVVGKLMINNLNNQ